MLSACSFSQLPAPAGAPFLNAQAAYSSSVCSHSCCWPCALSSSLHSREAFRGRPSKRISPRPRGRSPHKPSNPTPLAAAIQPALAAAPARYHARALTRRGLNKHWARGVHATYASWACHRRSPRVSKRASVEREVATAESHSRSRVRGAADDARQKPRRIERRLYAH